MGETSEWIDAIRRRIGSVQGAIRGGRYKLDELDQLIRLETFLLDTLRRWQTEAPPKEEKSERPDAQNSPPPEGIRVEISSDTWGRGKTTVAGIIKAQLEAFKYEATVQPTGTSPTDAAIERRVVAEAQQWAEEGGLPNFVPRYPVTIVIRN